MPALILVVDDVPTNRLVLRFKLQRQAYDVIDAADGHAAIALARRHKPDLVLLDVMMPGLDGLETCRRLKQDACTRHIPVMMITALDKPQDRTSGLESGADDFLSKPFDDRALFARVKNLLRLKAMLDELHAGSLGDQPDGASTPPVEEETSLSQASVLVICTERLLTTRRIARLQSMLGCTVHSVAGETAARALAAATRYDLFVIGPSFADGDQLRLASFLRSRPETRNTPIVMVLPREEETRAHLALLMGVSDCLAHPPDPSEFVARVRVQLRHKLSADRLRAMARKRQSPPLVTG